jgi:hypothetical protein
LLDLSFPLFLEVASTNRDISLYAGKSLLTFDRLITRDEGGNGLGHF